jgi:chromosome segregation ATPase
LESGRIHKRDEVLSTPAIPARPLRRRVELPELDGQPVSTRHFPPEEPPTPTPSHSTAQSASESEDERQELYVNAKIQELEEQIHDQQSRIHELEEERVHLKQEVGNLQAERDENERRLVESIKAKDGDAECHKTEIQALDTQINRLLEHRRDLEREIEDFRTQEYELREQLNNEKRKVQGLEEQRERELRNEMENFQRSMPAVRSGIEEDRVSIAQTSRTGDRSMRADDKSLRTDDKNSRGHSSKHGHRPSTKRTTWSIGIIRTAYNKGSHEM